MVVQCTSCRARFNAPDEFAGRKVRCRKCQAIFAVPHAGVRAGGGRNGKDVLFGESLENLDDAAGGGGGGRAGLDAVDPDELFQRFSAEFAAPRSNALYAYPMSRRVDTWLPVVLAFGPVAWACSQVFSTASAAEMPAWASVLRLTIILLGFFLLVLPACYWAVRIAARKCNYQIPHWTVWRVGAVFSMPFMFGVAMWLIAGQVSDFVTGCLLGLVMALPALWLLLRLDPAEGPITLTYAGAAFVGSTAAGVGVVVLFGLLANASTDPANKPTAMRQNPLGPGLRWDRPPDQPIFIARANPTPPPVVDVPPPDVPVAPATTTQATAGTPPTTQRVVPRLAPTDPFAPAATQATTLAPAAVGTTELPPTPPVTTTQPPAADPLAAGTELPPPSPLAVSMRLGFTGRYETVLAAPGPRSYIAVLTRAPNGQSNVTRWDIANWRPAGEATFLGKESDFHFSSDGALIVRVTTFPSLSLQVYSYLERRFREPVTLDPTQGEPTILGFAGPSLVLIHWRRADDGTSALEVVDAMAGKWTKRIPRIGKFEYAPGRFAISDDGRVAALLTLEAQADGEPAAAVEVYSLEATGRLAKTIPVTEVSWKGAPVRVSGLAVSPGRTEVSLLLENEGRGLMLSWDIDTCKRTRSYLEEAGLIPVGIDVSRFTGNALNYLDGGNAWLIYGCSIYDVGNGQRLGAFSLPTPMRQWVAGATCYVYRADEQGQGIMNAIRIDTGKLRAMLVKRGK